MGNLKHPNPSWCWLAAELTPWLYPIHYWFIVRRLTIILHSVKLVLHIKSHNNSEHWLLLPLQVWEIQLLCKCAMQCHLVDTFLVLWKKMRYLHICNAINALRILKPEKSVCIKYKKCDFTPTIMVYQGGNSVIFLWIIFPCPRLFLVSSPGPWLF